MVDFSKVVTVNETPIRIEDVGGEVYFVDIRSGERFRVKATGYRCRSCGYASGLLDGPVDPRDKCTECGSRYIVERPLTPDEAEVTSSPRGIFNILHRITDYLRTQQLLRTQKARNMVVVPGGPKLPDHASFGNEVEPIRLDEMEGRPLERPGPKPIWARRLGEA